MENIKPKATKDEVIKKQADFIESFKLMMGFENSEMTKSIVSPLDNRVKIAENKLNALESKLLESCRENKELRQKIEEYQNATNSAKLLLDKRQGKIEEVLKAIGNICISTPKQGG